MGKNNLNSFIGKMNDFKEIIEVNQGVIMDMAEQIREGSIPVQRDPLDRPRNKKVTKGQRTASKKTKRLGEAKETPPRANRGQQLLEQQERKRQEMISEENSRAKDLEAARNYWQEAMMLAEVVGPPVCKRRGRRRPGSL